MERHPKRPSRTGRDSKGAPQTVTSVLTSSFPHLGIAAKIKEHKIRKLWDECVGEAIARRARPQRLIGEVLYCAVATSPWVSELTYQRSAIIDKINSRAGSAIIKDIVFRIGPVTAPGGRPPVPSEQRNLNAREREFIEKTTGDIKDDKLKELIKRVMEKGKGV